MMWSHPAFKTQDEFEKRKAELLAKEASEPLTWWWLSFAGDEGWRGGCYVQARGFATALEWCNAEGINPHGEVRGVPLVLPKAEFDAKVPKELRWRLLTKADLEKAGHPIARMPKD